ncbi:unnamed protein product [Somion occarium]
MTMSQKETLLDVFRVNDSPSPEKMKELSVALDGFPVDKIERWFRTQRHLAGKDAMKNASQDGLGYDHLGLPSRDVPSSPSSCTDSILVLTPPATHASLSHVDSFPKGPPSPLADAEAVDALLYFHQNPVMFAKIDEVAFA